MFKELVNFVPRQDMHESLNEVSISSGYGLLPIWCQDIAETNTGIVSIWTIVNNIHWTLKQNRKTFVRENVICNMSAILSKR